LSSQSLQRTLIIQKKGDADFCHYLARKICIFLLSIFISLLGKSLHLYLGEHLITQLLQKIKKRDISQTKGAFRRKSACILRDTFSSFHEEKNTVNPSLFISVQKLLMTENNSDPNP